MKTQQNHTNSLFRMFLVVVLAMAIGIQMGCQDELVTPGDRLTAWNGPQSRIEIQSAGDTSVTTSAILFPDSALNLSVLQSHVTYLPQSVSVPTLVSMSVRNLDTTGLPLLPRCVVFGPDHDFRYLRNANVHMSAVDAGLVVGDPNNSRYMLYRLNESSGRWEFHDNPNIAKGAVFNFVIRRNGVYALGPLDTSWTTSGLISPAAGGTLNLRTSIFAAPAGAVGSPTVVSFTISVLTPEGLPGATDRIFDFGPDGLTFQTPCTAYISFEDAGITGEKVPVLQFYYFDPIGFTWVRQPTFIDWRQQRFVVTLTHFSRYAFGR